MILKSRFLNIYNRLFVKGSERSVIIKKNIVQSSGFKVASIIISLLVVPLTIDYVNPEQYGIWLTLSSVVQWISYFDLGLGHGLRNKFAEAKAIGNYRLASQYISTSYAIFAFIFLVLFAVFIFFNSFLHWDSLLKINQLSNSTLRRLMLTIVGFFCLTMVLKVINSLLLGDQRTSFASGISVAEQFLALIVIFILAKTTESNIEYLAIASYGIPCLLLLLVTLFLFSKKGLYNKFRPAFKNIDFSLTKNLLGLGVKFFILQVSLLVIFQFVNIILSRNCGQIAVTQYNLSFKYFNMIHMAEVIILTPFWSAFTDAYTKQDYSWMNSIYRRLNKYIIFSIPVLLIMLVGAPIFFKIWLHDSVEIPFILHVCMSLYMFSMLYASLQMYLLNGIGKVNVQLYVYVFFAIVSVPLMNVLSKVISIYGVLIVLSIVYAAQAIIGGIQIRKLLNDTATGIWNK